MSAIPVSRLEPRHLGPPLRTNQQHLPIGQLPWEDFEALCLRLFLAENGKESRCRLYGTAGEDQKGIDLLGTDGEGMPVALQCKRRKRMNPSRLKEAIHEFESGDFVAKVQRFILCCSDSLRKTTLDDALREEKRRMSCEHGVTLDEWDFDELNLLLKSHPEIVCDFFGLEWVRAFVGDHNANAMRDRARARELRRSLEERSRRYLQELEMRSGLRRKDEPDLHLDRNAEKALAQATGCPLDTGEGRHIAVTGEAGAGKSWVVWRWLSELKRTRPEANVLWLQARDWPFGASAEAMHEALGQFDPGVEAWLVIDGIDEQRDTALLKALVDWLCLVDRLGTWRIIGSVREVDLLIQSDLRHLFRRSARRRGPVHLNECCHVAVGRLSDEEILPLAVRHPALFKWWLQIPARASDELRSPFALMLASDLLAEGDDVSTLAGLTDLLDRWWVKRLPDDQRMSLRSTLRAICHRIVYDLSPHVDVSLLDARHEGRIPWLASHGVIREEDRGIVSFRSAILQDSAIERELLDRDPVALVAQVTGDPSRSRLVFPALSMRLARHWSEDRARFWELHDLFLKCRETRALHLVAASRLLIERARNLEDLAPMFRQFNREPELARRAIRRLIGTLIGTRAPRLGPEAGPWCALAAELAERAEAKDLALRLLLVLMVRDSIPDSERAMAIATDVQRRALHLAATGLIKQAQLADDMRTFNWGLRLLMPNVEVDAVASRELLEGIVTPERIARTDLPPWLVDISLERLRAIKAAIPSLLSELFASAFHAQPAPNGPSGYVNFVGSDWVYRLSEVFKTLLLVEPAWATEVLRGILNQSTSESEFDPEAVSQHQMSGRKLLVRAGGLTAWRVWNSNHRHYLEEMVHAWASVTRNAGDDLGLSALDVLCSRPVPAWMWHALEGVLEAEQQAPAPEPAIAMPFGHSERTEEAPGDDLRLALEAARFGIAADDASARSLLAKILQLKDEFSSPEQRRPTAEHAQVQLARLATFRRELGESTVEDPLASCLYSVETHALVWAADSGDLELHPDFAIELARCLEERLASMGGRTSFSEALPTVGLLRIAAKPSLRWAELIATLRARATSEDADVRAAIYEGAPYVFDIADSAFWELLDCAVEGERDPRAKRSLLTTLTGLCDKVPMRTSELLASALREPEFADDGGSSAGYAAHALVDAWVQYAAPGAGLFFESLAANLPYKLALVGPTLGQAANGLRSADTTQRERAALLFSSIGAAANALILNPDIAGTILSDWVFWWHFALEGRKLAREVTEAEALELLALIEQTFPAVVRLRPARALSESLGGLTIMVEYAPLRVLELLEAVPEIEPGDYEIPNQIIANLRALLAHPVVVNDSAAMHRTLCQLDRLLEIDNPHAIALALQNVDLSLGPQPTFTDQSLLAE